MSNSVLRARVETMEMGSKGLFCFLRALTSLYLTFRMGVAMCQITVDVIMHERSANPFS